MGVVVIDIHPVLPQPSGKAHGHGERCPPHYRSRE
jgi:hypothetical protein